MTGRGEVMAKRNHAREALLDTLVAEGRTREQAEDLLRADAINVSWWGNQPRQPRNEDADS